MSIPGLRSLLVLATLAVATPTIVIGLIIGLSERHPVSINKGRAR